MGFFESWWNLTLGILTGWLRVAPSPCFWKCSHIVLKGTYWLPLEVFRRSVLGWPPSHLLALWPKASSVPVLERQLLRLLSTTGLAGWGWGGSMRWTFCTSFFTSSPLPRLAPVLIVGSWFLHFGTIFFPLAPTWLLFLSPSIGWTSALCLARGSRALLYMLFSLCLGYTLLGFVLLGASDMRATFGVLAPCTCGCVLSLPSGSWWDWWVTLIIIIIITGWQLTTTLVTYHNKHPR